jgi:adenosylmethionine-8-amino-7-oxononanoate aminotransferase
MQEPFQIWKPYTQQALDPAPITIERAEGVYLYPADGDRLIDAISSWWVNIHGHAHPHIATAVADQAARMEHVIFAGFTHEPAQKLADKLRQVTPSGLSHIFFSDNGSTAVEVALKMALQHWRNRGKPERNKIVALEHAYHGDTVGAMAVSEASAFTDAFKDWLFPIERVHSAYCYRCPVGLKRETCDIECLERLESLLDARGQEIATVIVEPLIQGAGGMIMHPPEFLKRTRELCTRHGVLLIADEVFTGFGRTGSMFACDGADVTPDIMCLSKGLTGGFLPFAATLCTDEVYEPFHAPDRMRTLFHGHSYAGNPIGCAAAIASLEVFESEPVFERIRTVERIHRERLPLLAEHPMVGDARMIGTVAAMELKANDAGYFSDVKSRLYDFFLSRGVLLRPLGNILYILPPYVIQSNELHYVYDVVAEAIDHISES